MEMWTHIGQLDQASIEITRLNDDTKGTVEPNHDSTSHSTK